MATCNPMNYEEISLQLEVKLKEARIRFDNILDAHKRVTYSLEKCGEECEKLEIALKMIKELM